MSKKDWALIAAWVIYVVFLGPWLISAPSWIAVCLGVGLGLGLGIVTGKRFVP
jgi:hypothetical protein